MKNKKLILYIIPGWGEKITRKNYQELVAFAELKYEIVPISYVSRKGVLLSKNITKAKSQIIAPTSRDFILGFSVGALIAYQIASEYKFKQAIFCSVSTLLEKDLDLYPQEEVNKIFTSPEVVEMKKMKYGKPIGNFTLVYGEKEGPELLGRTKKLHKKYGGKLICIPDQQHEFKGKYIEAVKKLF